MTDRMEIEKKIHNYIDYLLSQSTAQLPAWNQEKIRSGKPNKWNYIDGCMIKAILALYEISGEERYLQFADSFLGWFVEKDGTIKTYDVKEYNLDNVCPATNLLRLYELTGKEKYKLAADLVRSQLDTMPRTESGNFWHKKIYPNQVWLDGLYMAQPFYVEYETKYRKMEGVNDSFKQFLNVEKYMRDPVSGLYYHGYDESRQMYWADPFTGHSSCVWLRALGWFACALVEVWEAIDECLYYERRKIGAMLEDLVAAVLPWQREDGLFYQVINQPEAAGNYPETSGTALLAYAMLKGSRLEIVAPRYQKSGKLAFEGITRKYLHEREDGSIGLDGICLVAGLGGADHRDGSLAYYFSEPIVSDDAKGTGPYLLAYTEMIRLTQNL